MRESERLLTAYYRFEKKAEYKSKTRLDCTHSTGNYPLFEQQRAKKAVRGTANRAAVRIGELKVYYVVTPYRYAQQSRKPDRSLTMNNKNLSGVFVPNVERLCGFGDVPNAQDLLLFVFDSLQLASGMVVDGSVLEVFVVKDKSKFHNEIYNMLCNGTLNNEIEELRASAVAESYIR